VFHGVEKTLQIHDADGQVVDSDLFTREMRVRATQGFEYALMAGPSQGEEEVLRERYGYKPEATEEEGLSRLEWEQEFVGLLQDTPPEDPAELRVWIQAREVIHEHLELLTQVFKEYGMSTRVLDGGFADDRPQERRAFISRFFDRMPSVRVAVDLKLAVHRNNRRGWAQNDLYDTDAMSIAVPYCAVVVADKAVADALGRVKASERHGTLVTPKLDELARVLPLMVEAARDLPDSSGWEALCPGVGFHPATPEQLAAEMRGAA
jgi:hypothetical protein